MVWRLVLFQCKEGVQHGARGLGSNPPPLTTMYF